jgi:hypothetical protein
VNNSNALSGELAERKRTLEQWSVAAYGEVCANAIPAPSTAAVGHHHCEVFIYSQCLWLPLRTVPCPVFA